MAFLSGEAGPATVSVDSGDSRQMYGHARAHATNALRKWSATKSDTRKTPLTIPVTSPVTKLATESRTTRECETRPLTLTCLIYHAIAHSCSWKHRFWGRTVRSDSYASAFATIQYIVQASLVGPDSKSLNAGDDAEF